jgi:hypothetical protein
MELPQDPLVLVMYVNKILLREREREREEERGKVEVCHQN